ncbi:MAG TPA: YihY/virulence factor BrkB family protein [Acidimicrobiales bacterium]|nr:YihY/virulence factor BrkB family protein [Acidimicrobiales bacterium]
MSAPSTDGPRTRREEALDLGKELMTCWREDRITGLAAEIAFFAILSLFPTLLATAAALGSLERFVGSATAERAREAVVEALGRILTAEADDTIGAVEALFIEQRPGLLTFGLLLTVYAMSRGFAGVIRALDVVYDLEERRSWVNIRAHAIGLSIGTVVMAAAVLLMLILGPLFGGGEKVADAIGLGGFFAVFWDVVRPPVAFAMLVIWATVVFHVAPNKRTPFRWDLPGALVAAVAWLLVSLGFRLYLELAAEGNQVFGVLGGALSVLFWLYLLGIGLLLGGEVNAILYRRYGPGPRGVGPEAEPD